MNSQQLDHLHAKYSGTGHADTTKYEFLTSHHRDTLASLIGNTSVLNYISTAEGVSSQRMKAKLIEKMIRPCGPPPPKEKELLLK